MAELRHQIPIDASPDKVFAASRRRLAPKLVDCGCKG
jgi:hypothetical protein